jgi:hypothetical protein
VNPWSLSSRQKFAFLALATPFLLAAADTPPKLEVTETQHVEFPAGGVLHLNHLSGECTIEGWDKPDLELTTVKYTLADYTGKDREDATKVLQETHVTATRHGDEVAVETHAPKRPGFLFLTFGVDVNVEYRIKVPRSARLMVDHRDGEVHVIDIAGDIRARVRQGLITLMLPADGQYTVDAHSTVGDVICDLAGQRQNKSWRFSHSFTNSASAPHKLDLHIGFGDIIIRKEQQSTP